MTKQQTKYQYITCKYVLREIWRLSLSVVKLSKHKNVFFVAYSKRNSKLEFVGHLLFIMMPVAIYDMQHAFTFSDTHH